MVVELKAELAKTLKHPWSHNIQQDPESLKENVKVAVKVLACSLYQDFPFDAAIALFLLADVLQVRGLKDQIITKLIRLYAHDELRCAHLLWNRKQENRPVWLPDPFATLNLAWERLPKDSHLNQLLVILFSEKVKNAVHMIGGEPINLEILIVAYGLVYELWDGQAGASHWDKPDNTCTYHEHDVPCSLESTVVAVSYSEMAGYI